MASSKIEPRDPRGALGASRVVGASLHYRSALREPRGILIVDDERVVRVIARKVLERAGYLVFDAGSVTSALLALHTGGEAIHLLLSDVHLPDGYGTDLARRAKGFAPKLLTLMMSGSSREYLIRKALLDADGALLSKPFHDDELLAAVGARFALDEAERA